MTILLYESANWIFGSPRRVNCASEKLSHEHRRGFITGPCPRYSPARVLLIIFGSPELFLADVFFARFISRGARLPAADAFIARATKILTKNKQSQPLLDFVNEVYATRLARVGAECLSVESLAHILRRCGLSVDSLVALEILSARIPIDAEKGLGSEWGSVFRAMGAKAPELRVALDFLAISAGAEALFGSNFEEFMKSLRLPPAELVAALRGLAKWDIWTEMAAGSVP
jgi:hypothetical protein